MKFQRLDRVRISPGYIDTDQTTHDPVYSQMSVGLTGRLIERAKAYDWRLQLDDPHPLTGRFEMLVNEDEIEPVD